MSKKIWSLFSLILIAAMVLSGCANNAATTAPTSAPAEPTATVGAVVAPEATATTAVAAEPTATAASVITPTTAAPAANVTITIWHQWDGAYLDAITAVFKAYEAAHPGVKIDLSKPDDVSNALKVAIPAGKGPDIIGWANDQIGSLALAGNIVNLDDKGITQDFLTSNFTQAAVKGVVWQGKVWAVPESVEGIALVYNKDLVTDEFLPKDPTNFDDLLAKATAFKQKYPDKVLVCNQGLGAADPYHAAPVYFGFGVPSYVDDQGKVYLNTPEALKAGEWIQKFAKVSLKETSPDICKANFTEGKVGMWWTGPWSIADIEKAKVNYGIVSMGKPFVGIKTLMVSKNAVDRGTVDTALDIIKFFTNTENEKKMALANKTIPANSAALADPEVAALPTLKGFGDSIALGIPMANTPYANAQWGPVGDATVAIWTGAQQPKDALDAAQKAIETAIAAMK